MESPLQHGVIWTGSDDGLVQLTRDGGKTWSNVTPPKDLMPEWIQINSIEASPNDPATAYVAATRYKWDDNRPYLYKTNDYGKSWKKITNGIPDTAFTRVIREDPNKRGLLYAGARGVLLTLWDAYDSSTADFMKAFYGHLQDGWSKARAAQEGMRQIRERHPHPFYWAPFALLGDVEAPPGPSDPEIHR